MKKFSIVINHISNDLYAIVLKSFELNENNEEINIETLIKTNHSLQECIIIQNDFINGNNN